MLSQKNSQGKTDITCSGDCNFKTGQLFGGIDFIVNEHIVYVEIQNGRQSQQLINGRNEFAGFQP